MSTVNMRCSFFIMFHRLKNYDQNLYYGRDKYDKAVFKDDDGFFKYGLDGSRIPVDFDPNHVTRGSDYNIWDYLSLDSSAWQALFRDFTGENQDEQSFINQQILQDRAHQNDLELQSNEMEYNSEAAKMQRMIDAGFNVNMMSAGNSSIGGGTSAAAPQSPVNANPLQALLNSADIGSSSVMKLAQRNNLDADTRIKNLEADWKPLEKESQIKLWNETAHKYVEEAHLSMEDARWIQTQREFFQITSDTRKEQLEQDLQNTKEAYNKIRQDIATSKAQEANINADTIKKEAETALVNKDIEYTDQLINESVSSEELNAEQKLLLVQQYEAAEKYLNGIPLSTDGHKTIHMLLSSDNPEDNRRGEALLDGVLRCAEDEYDQTIQNQWQNYGKKFMMDLGDGVTDMMPSFNVIMTPGRKRGKRR